MHDQFKICPASTGNLLYALQKMLIKESLLTLQKKIAYPQNKAFS